MVQPFAALGVSKAGGIEAANLSFEAAPGVDNTDATSYTFSSVSVGTADASRLVIVTFSYENAADTDNSVSSATIGGNAATIVVQQSAVMGAMQGGCGILVYNLTTGTTADIVINTDNTCDAMAIGVWSAYDLDSNTASATAEDDTAGSSVSAFSDDIDVPAAPSFLIGVFVLTTRRTVEWDTSNERWETQSSGPQARFGGADEQPGEQTAYTVGIDWNLNSPAGMALASWS